MTQNEQRNRLIADGWKESTSPFWREEPCFYHLSRTKTVILLKGDDGKTKEDYFLWKHDVQETPDFLDSEQFEVRRYKLHHSMNDLLWHNYGDRKIVH